MFGPTVGIGGLAASHLTSPVRLQRWTTSFLVYQGTYVVPGTVRNGFDRQFSVGEQRGVQMPTWPDGCRDRLQPAGRRGSTWYRTPGLKVAGKGFARLRTEAEGAPVLMCSLSEKQALLDSGDAACFSTPHDDGRRDPRRPRSGSTADSRRN
jgi:hypothetical protein